MNIEKQLKEILANPERTKLEQAIIERDRAIYNLFSALADNLNRIEDEIKLTKEVILDFIARNIC